MRRFFFLLVITFFCSLTSQAAEHLSIGKIKLGRPFKQVVADFESQGFVRKSDIDDASLFLGKFWGFTPTAAIPMKTGDSCFMVMMIVPDPGTPRKLFTAYNTIRAKVTEQYDVYGKEQNYYEDDQLNDFSPIEDRIKAARYGMATLYTEFQLPNGQIGVSINTHPDVGLGVFIVFTDKDYVDPDQSQVLTIEENKAIEPTRIKGVAIDRPADLVVRDLKETGLRDASSFIERYLYQKNHVTRLTGEYFGYQDCEFILSGEPNVDVVNIRFPASASWRELYSLYTQLRLALCKKYGSIYMNTDQVAGISENLESVDNLKALNAIRQGNASLQTLLLNRFDNHAFKVAIAYYPNDNSYHVAVIYYTPKGFSRSMSATK